jgi:hypothetical protein
MKLYIPRRQLVVNKHDLIKHLALSKKYIKVMAKTITWKIKKESQRKAKECAAHKNQKKERVYLSCGRKLSHPQPL